MRILIAEDDRIARFLLKKVALPYGDVVTASDGGIALEILETSAEVNEVFEMVILDVMMPDVDGFSLLRHIRSEDALRGHHTVVILTTAFADLDNDETGSARRADFVMHKPFRMQTLVNIFEKSCHL
ncbi:MAG: response regulator transcription factor [Deltaproteobacteria bacterium]|nr:response regulator transcription factor [Deltaproteobacteria bacterium]